MKEGFAIGGGLIVAGLVMQSVFGPFNWDVLRWPYNIIILAVFLLTIVTIHSTRESIYASRFLSTAKAAVPALIYTLSLTVIMGLTIQNEEEQGIRNMLRFWPFILCYIYMVVIVGLVCLKQSSLIVHRHATRATWTSLVSHLGLFIALTAASLGNGDMKQLKMITKVDIPKWKAIDNYHSVIDTPFGIELKKFIMEQYDDGSPKRFASEIVIHDKHEKTTNATVDVNKPVEVGRWKIYQYSYDTEAGPNSEISIFELVSDPWLPAVYTGIYMMIAGAVLMFVSGVRRKEQ